MPREVGPRELTPREATALLKRTRPPKPNRLLDASLALVLLWLSGFFYFVDRGKTPTLVTAELILFVTGCCFSYRAIAGRPVGVPQFLGRIVGAFRDGLFSSDVPKSLAEGWTPPAKDQALPPAPIPTATRPVEREVIIRETGSASPLLKNLVLILVLIVLVPMALWALVQGVCIFSMCSGFGSCLGGLAK